jgi:ATP-dependent Clp protease ATP-binding subunit ClpB
MGQTGVGKSASILMAAEHLFGTGHLIQFDMSEYQVQGSLERLIGERSGDRGLFGYHVTATQGYGVILFDEIEKAHPRVLDILLSILAQGRFSLANGETLDLTRYVIAATTNIGSRVLQASNTTDADTLARRAYQAATQDLRLELLGRFDLMLTFSRLGYEQLGQIARLHLGKTLEIVNGQGHHITVDPGALQFVQAQGDSKDLGARPIRNAAMRVIGDLISDEMDRNGDQPVHGTIRFDRAKNRCFLDPQ